MADPHAIQEESQETDLEETVDLDEAERLLLEGYEEDSGPGEPRERSLTGYEEQEEEAEEDSEEELSQEEQDLQNVFDEIEDKAEKDKEEAAAPVDKTEQRIRKMEGKYGELNGRQGDVLSQIEKLQAQIQDLKNSGGVPRSSSSGPSPDRVAEIMASGATESEKYKLFKEEYPDWGEAIQEEMAMKLAGIASTIDNGNYEGQIAAVKSELVEMFQSQMMEAQLDMRHEGWREEINSPVFHKWLQAQDEETQGLVHSPNVKDAMRLLNSYDESKKIMLERRSRRMGQEADSQNRLKSAVAPSKSGGSRQRAGSSESVNDAFESAYWN